MDVIRTQGEIAGLKAQTDPGALSQAREQLTKDGKPASDADVMQRAYNNAMQQYGTGSDLQKAAQAVTGTLTALAGNNLAGALASGASPYLATEIKKLTTTDGQVNVAANAIAHAVLGAVTAQLNNQSAVAGGLGAGGGELAARYIASQLFPDKTADQLNESEKQQVSALSQLASGLAGGLATGDAGGAVTAAQTGKNAVENNFLSVTQLDNFAQKARTCEGAACQQVIQDMVDTNLKQQKEMLEFCSSQPDQCGNKYGYLVDQWDVFDQAIKQLDTDGKLPNEFKNYLSAVYSSSMEAEGTVANLGWQQKFEALGLDKDTAAAMAATVPAMINAKGGKSGANYTLNKNGQMLGANGVRVDSKTIWKGKGQERIDVENPAPGKRTGQLHYQDNKGNKYYYDPITQSFPDAPKSVNAQLKNSAFKNAVEKGMSKYLGEQ
ncbi:VENN motif pre-toxin domain-containing protein [Hafnia psychrotolerans]|uniref:VENN motif-containing domain-containing protein n=1 Tax=Hafnia psychrotolerans TaxID=1477018 RepID=A0ABQ1H6H8_9GAMM|nr:VENN motif pre-toxin domain-containing protein [Hafnia psychrotolerans]GGA59906.1 hypothetical protein GCM10011328_39200 [Hafnia psychrotolerans]